MPAEVAHGAAALLVGADEQGERALAALDGVGRARGLQAWLVAGPQGDEDLGAELGGALDLGEVDGGLVADLRPVGCIQGSQRDEVVGGVDVAAARADGLAKASAASVGMVGFAAGVSSVALVELVAVAGLAAVVGLVAVVGFVAFETRALAMGTSKGNGDRPRCERGASVAIEQGNRCRSAGSIPRFVFFLPPERGQ